MRLLFVWVALLLPQLASAEEPQPWDAVMSAHDVDAWNDVELLAFTFKHQSGTERSYRWWVKRHVVRVTIGEKSIDIPIRAADLRGDEQIAAHKAFTNDSFWLLFEFHLRWDTTRLEDLGEHPSPFGGKARAFRVTYPATGGYTPGDAYVAFIGQDGKVMGWSYHRGGAAPVTMTTTRGGYKAFGPLVLPTRFERPDGSLQIEFTDIAVR